MDKYEARKILEKLQGDEATEIVLYWKMASMAANEEERKVLERIALEEKEHYRIMKKITEKDVRPSYRRILWYSLLMKLFGITFTMRMLEGDEEEMKRMYEKIENVFPQVWKIKVEETKHERELMKMVKESHLKERKKFYSTLLIYLFALTSTLTGMVFAELSRSFILYVGALFSLIIALTSAFSGYESISSVESFTIALVLSLLSVSPFVLPVPILASLAVSVLFLAVITFVISYFFSVVDGESISDILFRKALQIVLTVIIGFASGKMARVFILGK